MVSAHHRRFKDIVSVIWKPLSTHWTKVNSNISLLGTHASCGGIFCDYRGTFLSCFANNLGRFTVSNQSYTTLCMEWNFL